MHLGRYVKDPDDDKRYVIEYDDWLDLGETIATFTSSVSPSGLTIHNLAIDTGGRKTSFFASAGNDGVTYKVLFTITTSGGQTKEDAVYFTLRAN